jgi:iron complex transport system ATP-binding protein
MTLAAQNLSGGYSSIPAVQKICFELQSGEWLSLVGANGSGKSTLLKLLSRMLVPQQGQVLLDGKLIHSEPAKAIAQKLAVLPQQQVVPNGVTVRQLVGLGRTPHQSWWQWEMDSHNRQIIDLALQQTQMCQYCDRPVEQLSGGERQRAFLAMALAQSPQILLLDEPTTYLDIRYQLELLELLKYLNRETALSIITVLHEINLAARYSDRIALLKDGQILAIGTPSTVLTAGNLKACFEIEAEILETTVGIQVCPLYPTHKTQIKDDLKSQDFASNSS